MLPVKQACPACRASPGHPGHVAVSAGSWQCRDDRGVIITWIGIVLTLLGAVWLILSLILLGGWLLSPRSIAPAGNRDPR